MLEERKTLAWKMADQATTPAMREAALRNWSSLCGRLCELVMIVEALGVSDRVWEKVQQKG